MALDLQSIHFASRQQTPGKVQLILWPSVLVGSDEEVLLSQNWVFLSDTDGTMTFELPVKETGTIKWNYILPSNPGRVSQGSFNLEKTTGTIEFDDLVGPAGADATDSVKDYVDQQIAALPLPPKVYVANILQDGASTIPGEGDSVANVIIDELDLTFEYAGTGTFLLSSPLFAQQENGNWPLVAGQLYQVTDPPASKVYFGAVSDLVHSGPGFVAMTILDPKTGMSAVDGWSGTLELRVWPNTAEPE